MARHIHTGGTLSPEEVVGREVLIARLWQILEQRQSVRLHAERRMGKTSIIKKMTAQAPDSVIAIYRDLEHINSPAEFLEYTLQDIREWLTQKRRLSEWFKKAWEKAGGTEVAGILKLPPAQASEWKLCFQTVMRDVAQNVPERLIFFWDEMPLMLHNIKRTQGEAAAMSMLDALRELRHNEQTKSLRMVFTGSIGLHHILTQLRRAGHANQPVNDMEGVLVPPLELEDACSLAAELLEGIGVTPAEGREQAASEIAVAVDCVPFYIHHLVKRLRDHPKGTAYGLDHLDAVRSDLLFDSQDALDLRYYRDRIKTYYLPEQRDVAFATLDALAKEEPLTLIKLRNRVKLQTSSIEDESLRETLELLEMDHYIQRSGEGYRFQMRLIRDGWRAMRGIA